MKEKIKQEAGTVWPNEYDWQTQFAEALNGQFEFVSMDAGKVRGVVLSYLDALDTIADLAGERKNMLKSLGMMMAEIAELKQSPSPRKFQIGDRVKAIGGFSVGSEGYVQFVEPSYEKVWVLREHATGPCFYHPDELKLIEAVQ